jgi:hypothetical protein
MSLPITATTPTKTDAITDVATDVAEEPKSFWRRAKFWADVVKVILKLKEKS